MNEMNNETIGNILKFNRRYLTKCTLCGGIGHISTPITDNPPYVYKHALCKCLSSFAFVYTVSTTNNLLLPVNDDNNYLLNCEGANDLKSMVTNELPLRAFIICRSDSTTNDGVNITMRKFVYGIGALSELNRRGFVYYVPMVELTNLFLQNVLTINDLLTFRNPVGYICLDFTCNLRNRYSIDLALLFTQYYANAGVYLLFDSATSISSWLSLSDLSVSFNIPQIELNRDRTTLSGYLK